MNLPFRYIIVGVHDHRTKRKQLINIVHCLSKLKVYKTFVSQNITINILNYYYGAYGDHLLVVNLQTRDLWFVRKMDIVRYSKTTNTTSNIGRNHFQSFIEDNAVTLLKIYNKLIKELKKENYNE